MVLPSSPSNCFYEAGYQSYESLEILDNWSNQGIIDLKRQWPARERNAELDETAITERDAWHCNKQRLLPTHAAEPTHYEQHDGGRGQHETNLVEHQA